MSSRLLPTTPPRVRALVSDNDISSRLLLPTPPGIHARVSVGDESSHLIRTTPPRVRARVSDGDGSLDGIATAAEVRRKRVLSEVMSAGQNYQRPEKRASTGASRLAAAVSLVESTSSGRQSVRPKLVHSSSTWIIKRNMMVKDERKKKKKKVGKSLALVANCASKSTKRKRQAKQAVPVPSHSPDATCVRHLIDQGRLSPGIGVVECRAAVGNVGGFHNNTNYRWRVDLHPDGSLQYGNFRTFSPTALSEFLKGKVPCSDAMRREDGWHSLFVQTADASNMSLNELRTSSTSKHRSRKHGMQLALGRMVKLVQDDQLSVHQRGLRVFRRSA